MYIMFCCKKKEEHNLFGRTRKNSTSNLCVWSFFFSRMHPKFTFNFFFSTRIQEIYLFVCHIFFHLYTFHQIEFKTNEKQTNNQRFVRLFVCSGSVSLVFLIYFLFKDIQIVALFMHGHGQECRPFQSREILYNQPDQSFL